MHRFGAVYVSPQEARALAMLHSAYQLLSERYDEHGPGLRVALGWDHTDEAIAALEGEQSLPRLIVTERQEVRT